MNKNRLCDCVVAAVRAALQPGPGKSFAVPLIKHTVRLLAVPDAADQGEPRCLFRKGERRGLLRHMEGTQSLSLHARAERALGAR